MTEAWSATVGSSASTAVRRMTEVSVERIQELLFCDCWSLTPFPDEGRWGSGWSQNPPPPGPALFSEEPNVRAKCWQGWRLRLVSLEAGRENRPFSFIGEMREGWVVGVMQRNRGGRGASSFLSWKGENKGTRRYPRRSLVPGPRVLARDPGLRGEEGNAFAGTS